MEESKAKDTDQEVGYLPPESVSDVGRPRPDTGAFPSDRQARQAANDDPIRYSHATTDADVENSAGTGSTIPGQLGGTRSSETYARAGTGRSANNPTPLDDKNASSPGMATNNSGDYPGPGTASDRGTGNVGSTPFGTGSGDTGLETSYGLDEENSSATNSTGYNAADISSPTGGAGVTGSGTPGRDNQFNEMGTDDIDLSPRDSTGGTH
jgi:hypothetical protein